MEQRVLGKSGLKVSVLGYGAMALHDPKDISDKDAEHLLGSVLDSGVTFVDTSPDYGASEERIGKYISHRRSEYYLASKCGCNITEDGVRLDPIHLWTRERLISNIELSLRRLGTEYIDIWQIHNASVEDVDRGDLVAVMEEVKQSGKVHHVSISSELPHIATYIERRDFATYQIPYSALQREHELVIGDAAAAGCGVIVRGGVAQGSAVTGRRKELLELWEKAGLDELLDEGESRSQFVLRYTISHPGMSTTIVGTRSRDHLAENLVAIESGPLADDVYASAKARLDDAGESPAKA
jgi:aryl-alcohol dehydrogenase-like predicted oxidoreductase